MARVYCTRALETPAMAALDRELDDPWRADRDTIIADMNGSAVFLLAALKMRLGSAWRRGGAGSTRPCWSVIVWVQLPRLLGEILVPEDFRSPQVSLDISNMY